MAGLLMDHSDGFFDWLRRIPPLTSPHSQDGMAASRGPFEWIHGVRPSALVAWSSGVLLGFIANRFVPELVQSTAALIYHLSGNGQAAATVSTETARSLAPLVGMVFAVIVLTTLQFAKRVRRALRRVKGEA